MRFILDTQLLPALAKHLSNKGYDCIHTTFYDDGHLLKDLEIVHIAIKENRTVVTKDSDFRDKFSLKRCSS